MTRTSVVLAACMAAALVLPPGARAHHRQTPALVPLTDSGDTELPRVAAFGGTLALAIGPAGAREIYAVKVRRPTVKQLLSSGGDNANPAMARNGRLVAWDTDQSPYPGRRLRLLTRGGLLDAPIAPDGVVANPAVNRIGTRVAFESDADLTGDNPAGALQVFHRSYAGQITQLSHGEGDSRNAAMGATDTVIAFESSSHPVTGADTGVAQIWIGNAVAGSAARITAGAGASRLPAVSEDNRVVTFESTADLAGDGHDTGTSQVYLYDTLSATFARLTDHAAGCTQPSVYNVERDYRIGFTCAGEGFFYQLGRDILYELPIAQGDTNRVVAEVGNHFLVVSTTADLLAGTGTTSGHRLYLWNLYKKPATPTPGTATWFPYRGIPPLH